MDEVTANMAELSGHVSALAGLTRGISAGLGAPLLRVAAFAFGVRRAVSLRRAPRVMSELGAGRNALPAGRGALTGRARPRGGLPRQRAASGSAGREDARR
jgi:hypothetical protein